MDKRDQAYIVLQTRAHPRARGKIQYRYLDNRDRWRWAPQSTRGAPYDEPCPCGGELSYIQYADGTVYQLCRACGHKSCYWWPARAYELHRDHNAAWRTALRRTHQERLLRPLVQYVYDGLQRMSVEELGILQQHLDAIR